MMPPTRSTTVSPVPAEQFDSLSNPATCGSDLLGITAMPEITVSLAARSTAASRPTVHPAPPPPGPTACLAESLRLRQVRPLGRAASRGPSVFRAANAGVLVNLDDLPAGARGEHPNIALVPIQAEAIG
jgi:hypothetical protein